MVGCIYISEQESKIKVEGWYLLVDSVPYFPEAAAEVLHMKLKDYIQILKGCNATQVIFKNEKHYVFNTREDVESAIATFKLIGAK